MAAIAAMESANTSLRVRAGHETRALAGNPHGGPRTFGYEADRVTVDKAEAKLIREAARSLVRGATLSAIARDWNERRVPTPSGDATWWPQAIGKVLRSDRIAGLGRHNGDLIDGTWPAILDGELRDRVLGVLEDPNRRAPGERRRYLLTSMLRCGICDAALEGGSSHQSRRYVCRAGFRHGCGRLAVTGECVDDEVRDQVITALTSRALRLRVRSAPKPGDLRRLAAEIETLAARMNELARDFAVGLIQRSEWLAARDAIRVEADAKEQELQVLQGHAELPDVPTDRDGLEAWWDDADVNDRRALLHAVVDHVTVAPASRPGPFDPERVTISWRG